ncbi:phage tail tape measure protein [Conservatibacter flavescens]|uniref:Phage tail tape measure protein n=1 Tax=Conservatibacter flavescens TaxID=28161 RepID=A0A2M8S503_9PAST|nr:phage tail tape measure protein [Conservatibacter flavescens]PJG86219.1 phage tail tape measure protein [Conservatibacter flavescens]
MSDLELKLKLRAEDLASRVLDGVVAKTKRANDSVTQSTKQNEQAQQEAKQQTARVVDDIATKSTMRAKRAAEATRTLGIRTEKDLQAELRRTRQAYQTLAKSGVASARDLMKAREAVIRKERELQAEMGKTPLGQRVANVGRGMMGVAAGVAAGAMVMREPVRKSMSYDRELAMVANTAFSDRDVAGRIAGKKELHEAVKGAVQSAGGTKEEALASLNALLASGMDAKIAMDLLPTLQKGAVATGASAEDLAAITISALQNGIAQADIGKALDMAVAAGQAGQFELQDMARWLPQQMAAAKSMGLQGLEGFETLLVANQQARVTAGTNDEAGNNLVNLLAKVTAKETNERFKKYEYIDSKGKTRSINFAKSMEAYKGQGKNSLEAFMAIMDNVVGSDENYKALQQRLKTAKKEDQKKILDEMTDIVEATAIGQIISDRQAVMALVGIRNNAELGEEVKKQIKNSEGAVDTSHKVIADTNDYKVDKMKSQAEFGQMEGLKGFNNLLGSASEKLSDYMAEYPDLTAALAGAGTGIAALGAAALAAAGSISLLGGGKSGSAGAGDLLRRSSKGAKGASRLGKFGKGVGFLAKGGVVADLILHSEELNKGENEWINTRHEDHAKMKMMSEEEKKEYINKIQAAQQKREYDHAKELLGSRFRQFFIPQENIERAKRVVADYEEARQVSSLALSQTSIQGQVEAATGTLSQYQADFNAFGETISAGLQAGLAAQSHTLDNRITVELDGAVIAENVSQRQFNFLNRGVA